MVPKEYSEVDLTEGLLSKREILVLQYIADGYKPEEIASAMFISKVTVDTHRRNINIKLKVTNIAHGVAVGFRKKLIK